MKTKLLSAVLGVGLVLGLAACGGNSDPGYSDKVLPDTDHAAYVVMGEGKVGTKDATPEEIKDLGWDYSEAGEMTATSVKAVSKASEALAKTLKDKPLAALYLHENIRLGANLASWTTKAINAEGEVVELNGSYALKTGSVNYDPEDDVYSVDEWIPSPEHYTENLTPSVLYMGPHSEEKDAAGNDHNANPAAIAGAGVYTVVTARYSKAVGDSWFGMGIIKTADLTEPQPEPEYIVDHLSVVGKINGQDDWDAGIEMTQVDDTAFVAYLDLKAGDEIKVRANDEWTYSWGAGVLEAGEGYVENDANIAITADGPYALGIELTGLDLMKEGAKNATAMSLVSAEKGSEANPYTVSELLERAEEIFAGKEETTWDTKAVWTVGMVIDTPKYQYSSGKTGVSFTLGEINAEGTAVVASVIVYNIDENDTQYDTANLPLFAPIAFGDTVVVKATLELYVKGETKTVELARNKNGSEEIKCDFVVLEQMFSFSAIGTINGTNWDTDFEFGRTDFTGFKFGSILELHKDEQFKFRVTGDWGQSWGPNEFTTYPDCIGAKDGNFVALRDCVLISMIVINESTGMLGYMMQEMPQA